MHLSKVKLGLATGTAALIFVTASDFAPITAYATTLSSAGGAPDAQVFNRAPLKETFTSPTDSIALSADVQQQDQFVLVQNNQYQVALEAKTVLGVTAYNTLTSEVAKANEVVVASKAVIDPMTKSFTLNQVTTRSSALPSTKLFWWGVRYYFTSNAQVANASYKWQTAANVSSGLTAIPVYGAPMAAPSAWLNQLAASLTHYNAIHPHSHIYLDLNYSLTWSLHTY